MIEEYGEDDDDDGDPKTSSLLFVTGISHRSGWVVAHRLLPLAIPPSDALTRYSERIAATILLRCVRARVRVGL